MHWSARWKSSAKVWSWTLSISTCIARSASVAFRLWKYLPVSVHDRLGLQMGTWAKAFVNVAPSSTSSRLVFGSGVAELVCGKELPSIWSRSSTTT